MYYIGCDQHKHYSQVVLKDQEGSTYDQKKLYHNNREMITEYFSSLPQDSLIALEASGFDPWLCDLLEECGLTVKLVHPKRTRAIAEERIKTDNLSANILADLLRANLISEAYKAPIDIRKKRYMMRYRQSLVNLRSSTKNKIHGILSSLGIQVICCSDLFGKAGRKYLESIKLDEPYKTALKNYLFLIDVLKDIIGKLEVHIRQFFKDSKEVELLKTIPGIGSILAPFIWAEIGDINRFYSSSKLASYAGVVPSLHKSGQINRFGHITKQGNKYLRWAFVEAAHVAAQRKKDPLLTQFYSKVRFKKGSNIAIVATARKLLTYAYWVLKNKQSFKYQGRS